MTLSAGSVSRFSALAWSCVAIIPAAIWLTALPVLTARVARVYPVSSDDATGVLEAAAVLRGNVLLRGWTLSSASFALTDLPFYVAGMALRPRARSGARRARGDLRRCRRGGRLACSREPPLGQSARARCSRGTRHPRLACRRPGRVCHQGIRPRRHHARIDGGSALTRYERGHADLPIADMALHRDAAHDVPLGPLRRLRRRAAVLLVCLLARCE